MRLCEIILGCIVGAAVALAPHSSALAQSCGEDWTRTAPVLKRDLIMTSPRTRQVELRDVALRSSFTIYDVKFSWANNSSHSLLARKREPALEPVRIESHILKSCASQTKVHEKLAHNAEMDFTRAIWTVAKHTSLHESLKLGPEQCCAWAFIRGDEDELLALGILATAEAKRLELTVQPVFFRGSAVTQGFGRGHIILSR